MAHVLLGLVVVVVGYWLMYWHRERWWAGVVRGLRGGRGGGS